jgi:anti-anti-sigma factor
MFGSPPSFEICERQDGLRVRLSLSGELDMQAAPVLEQRLARHRATRTPLCLDLSKLTFIDSTGLHLLVRTVGDARLKRWKLEVDPEIPKAVMSVLKLVHLDRFVLSDGGR